MEISKSPEPTNEKFKHTILSIDFDDTIVIAGPFPTIQGLQPEAKQTLQLFSQLGCTIIINTCRAGESEQQVVDFLRYHEIPFDYINENHPEIIERFGFNCRKIYGDFMIDDKCLFFKDSGEKHMPWASIKHMTLAQINDEAFEPLLLKLKKLQEIC